MGLTVGPESTSEDERVIAKGYSNFVMMVLTWVPGITAYYVSDLKWTVAAIGIIGLTLLNETNGRLHDLCIRARRRNILLETIRRQSAGEIDSAW